MKNDFGNLTELHVHIGSAVDPAIMWEIAHEQAIKLRSYYFSRYSRNGKSYAGLPGYSGHNYLF